jgi:asparagine synthase (glutamine-hydrolysing)
VCGIAGKLSSREPPDEALLERMCEAVRHRGPDSRGVFVDEMIGLGVQRLAVIDLETGDQPIFNEDRSVVVVLNGEIYNYLELRRDLERRGHRFSTRSDTEVIVHLYEERGEECVERLRGMFAFALWDRRRRRLLLARDRVGKKPLFYCRRGDTLWFASEPRAIVVDDAVPREINPAAIDRFLHYKYVPHPESGFAALRKLPPAHLLTYEDGRLETHRYWALSYASRIERAGDDELGELILEQLLEATRLRLRSDVPVGAFLSGGIDSSAVVAAMARLTTGQVKTFSIGFDVPDYDETGHARAVAALYGTDHHEEIVGPSAMELLPRLVWHYGEPFADESAIPSFRLAELARRHVTVALTGDGGDESFAGYLRYVRMLREQRPDETYSAVLACFRDHERAALYERDFLAHVGEQDSVSLIQQPYRASDATSVLERLLHADVQSYLPCDLLVKMDIATMAHSLEARSPLLDQAFMETAAALPADGKLRGGETKRLFKHALRDWLPAQTLRRSKMGFVVPLDDWFRGELRHLPLQVLLDPRATRRGIFRRDRVEELIRAHLAGTENNGSRLWTLLQLELWQQMYIDARAVGPATIPLSDGGARLSRSSNGAARPSPPARRSRPRRNIHLVEVGLKWPPETFLQWKFATLAAHGIDVTVCSTVPRRPAPADVPGAELRRFPSWEEPRPVKLLGLLAHGSALLVRDPRRLAKLVVAVRKPAPPALVERSWRDVLAWLRIFLPLARLRPDVVQFEWERNAVSYLPLLDVWDCPMVVSCRGDVNAYVLAPEQRRWAAALPWAYARAAAVQCVCEALRDEAVRYGLDLRKAWLIKAGVDPDFFRPPVRDDADDSLLRVVSVGRLAWVKGYEYGLQGIRLLRDRGAPVRYEIVGDGPDRDRIAATIDDLQLRDVVRLRGELGSEEIRDVLHRSDVLLHSSVTEGIPNAIVEAMACALPVVAAASGGVPEAVTHGTEGLLVPPRDPDAIATTLHGLWDDPDLRRRLGSAARRRVLSDFTLNRAAADFVAMYEHVLSESPAAGP